MQNPKKKGGSIKPRVNPPDFLEEIKWGIFVLSEKYWILEGIVWDSISEYTLDPNGKAKIEEIVILPVSAWYLTYLISQQTTITTLEYRLTISYNIYKC